MLAAHPRFLLGLSAIGYVAVTVAFVTLERPGLGIGHFYYIPILLLAVATGPVAGALGGLLGTVLYTGGHLSSNPHIPSTLEWSADDHAARHLRARRRLVGWFARRQPAARPGARAASRAGMRSPAFRTHASFEAAIDRRLAEVETFVLLVGDVDQLGALSGGNGREHGGRRAAPARRRALGGEANR